MPLPRTKPSRTSLLAFFMVVLPVLYVLSYAPVVRFYDGETEHDLDIPFPAGAHFIPADWLKLADSSRYPPYKPIDWLIDNTPLQKPLYFWADIWGVHTAFEKANWVRRSTLPPSDEV